MTPYLTPYLVEIIINNGLNRNCKNFQTYIHIAYNLFLTKRNPLKIIDFSTFQGDADFAILLRVLEATPGFEPGNKGFADLC